MLQHGANIHECNPHLESPLFLASKYGHAEVVQGLLDYGSRTINDAQDYGFTPILAAAESGHLNVVRILLEHGAKVDEIPVQGNDPPVTRYRTKNRFTLWKRHKRGYNPLLWAVYQQNEQLVEVLLQHGANPNGVNETPIAVAMRYNMNMSIARMLIQHGADPDGIRYSSSTAYWYALATLKVDAAKEIVRWGASTPEDIPYQAPLKEFLKLYSNVKWSRETHSRCIWQVQRAIVW